MVCLLDLVKASGEILQKNNLLVVVSKKEELELISNSLSNYEFIKFECLDDIISSNFEILDQYPVVLDSSCKLFNFLKEQNLLVQLLEQKFNYLEYQKTKVFECPKLYYLFDRSNYSNYTDEHKKEINFVITRLFNLIAILENLFFKNTKKKEEKSFSDLIVQSSSNQTFKLVKQIPENKEEGIQYLTLSSVKELNRIFDIIDSIVEVD